MSKDANILKIKNITPLERGGGIVTLPLFTKANVPDGQFTTGISTYPKGKGAPLHAHNCDEQVTLLEGEGEVEVEGVITPLAQYDSTYIPANKLHAFRNTGEAPMRILWIYGSTYVTRTFAGSGETVEHLSAADMMAAKTPQS